MASRSTRLTLGRRLSRTILLGTIAAIAALAVAVALLGHYLRGEVRGQILSRDVELLESVVFLEYERLEQEFFGVPVDFRHLAVSASALRGVLAMAVYDVEGWPQEFVPDTALAPGLASQTLTDLRQTGSHARYDSARALHEIFVDARPESADRAAPIVDIIVPVASASEDSPVAYARFWIDGAPMAAEFGQLDRRLLGQGLAAWLAGSGLTLLIGWLSARRLHRVGDELEIRNRSLERANAELDLAARSSAVGAITAHLIHGLRSPLAGIGAYLRSHGDADARDAARRMEILVRDTLAVLRTENAPRTRAEMSLLEIAQVLDNRLRMRAEAATVRLELRLPTDDSRQLPSRECNLILLILENLLANAIEASSGGGSVILRVEDEDEFLRFCVEDCGRGIPETLRDRLFEPGATSKADGAGLGLAISRHLARALGGDLILENSSSAGTCFTLTTPLAAGSRQSREVS